ncbi:MAG TPA: ABC transporter permease [Acidobacteriaceae bacterium]
MKLFDFRFARQKEELDEELRAHLRMAVADRVERGETVDEARQNAMREMGNLPLIEDVTRTMWGGLWLERVLQDVKYALRQLRRAPGFTVTVVVTLALGLGATVAMYTVVDRVLLRPLPYRDARSLVNIQETSKTGEPGWGSAFLDIAEWQARSHTLASIAFWGGAGGPGGFSYLEGKEASVGVSDATASANLFPTLGVHAAMGRTFLEGRNGAASPEDAHSIVLSDAVWRSAFGADPHIVGKSVKVSGERYTVIGVMPRGFAFPYGGEHPMVWTPIVPSNGDLVRQKHTTPNYTVIARLAPGASLTAAEAELKTIQAAAATQYMEADYREHASSVRMERYGDSLVDEDVRKSLLALAGASGVLWLIACVNVTSLLLARATARQREIAVRGALGASRGRIGQQLVIEGLMLSSVASLAGVGLAMLTLRIFEHGLKTQFHIYTALTPNLRVLAVLLGLTAMSALVSSAWPAMSAARAAIEPALRQGATQSGTGRRQHRLRGLLVVAEIAMSLTLLVACGLLLRTIYTLRHVPLGFRTDHVMVANMSIPNYKYEGRDLYKELYEPLLERVQHMPGVQSAALMSEVPLGRTFNIIFSLGDGGGSAIDVRRGKIQAQASAVTPDKQKVFRFSMLRGRFFNDGDTATSAPVVVVNRAFVREYEGEDGDPGKILGTPLLTFRKDQQAAVVGVLDDERQVTVAEPSQPEIEECLPQITPDSMFYQPAGMAMDLAVRTERDPAAMTPELRRLMREASPELANSTFTTMNQVVEDSYGSQQLAARLLEIFGGTALVLCIAGIYGLLAYLVTQRTRELGIRIALGAQRSRVMGMVLRKASGMLLCGLAAGLLLAYATSRLLRTLLYGVQPHDPWTMAAVTLVLLAGGLAASYLPARRAASVDPMEALRSE